MKSINKNLTPSQIRNVLIQTANRLTPNEKNQYGSGMVDALAAVNATIDLTKENKSGADTKLKNFNENNLNSIEL